jgi:hypothetical protein
VSIGDLSRREFLLALGATWAAGTIVRPATAAPPPRSPPSAEIRAVWLSLFDPFDLFAEADRPAAGPTPDGVREVMDLLAASGVNTAFVMVDSWYAYSIVHPTYEPKKSLAEWDAFGVLLEGARVRGIQVHLSYPLVNDRSYPSGPGEARRGARAISTRTEVSSNPATTSARAAPRPAPGRRRSWAR